MGPAGITQALLVLLVEVFVGVLGGVFVGV